MKSLRSISIRLPMLISVLLLVTVGVASWMAYRGAREALFLAAIERLGFTDTLSELMEEPISALLDGGAGVAANAQIRAYVLNPTEDRAGAIRAILTPLTAAPEALSVEILDAGGALLLNVGAEVPPSPLRSPGSAVEEGISPIYELGSDVVYDTAIPIRNGNENEIAGWLILRRTITTGGTLGELFAGMIGNESRLLVGNRNGGAWTDLAGQVPPPPVTFAPGTPSYRYVAKDGELRIARASTIPRTPWVIWLEQTERVVVAPARTFLMELIPSALLLVLFGMIAAWIMTRGVTESIMGLAAASHGLAEGDFEIRVKPSRKDEIGVLEHTFNRMAEQIGGSHKELEHRVEERTVKLRAAYRQLVEKQNELVRAERLATLGQLASGVGHELRNPLGVMTNAVYYLDIVLSDAPDTVHEYLGILRGQIGLSEKIVGDLLDFARLKPPQVELTSIESIVDLQILRMGPQHRIRIEKEIPVDLPAVAVDPIQVGQIVLNLLMNGAQAMADRGGTLWVRARALGDRVELSVTDEGDGIPPENLEKIFEPLFTTKARGIGLGLAVSRALAEGNRSTLVASSPPGEGATFTLDLPTRPEASA